MEIINLKIEVRKILQYIINITQEVAPQNKKKKYLFLLGLFILFLILIIKLMYGG